MSQALTKNANYPLGCKTWLQPLECYLFHVPQVTLHFLRRALICHTIATERSGQVTHRYVQLLVIGEHPNSLSIIGPDARSRYWSNRPRAAPGPPALLGGQPAVALPLFSSMRSKIRKTVGKYKKIGYKPKHVTL